MTLAFRIDQIAKEEKRGGYHILGIQRSLKRQTFSIKISCGFGVFVISYSGISLIRPKRVDKHVLKEFLCTDIV